MLNEERVRLRAKAFAYEQTEGKEMISVGEYFERGNSNRVFLSNIPMGVITYILLVAILYVCAHDLADSIRYSMGPVFSLVILIVLLVVFSLVYALIATRVLRRAHGEKRGTFWKYRFNKAKIAGHTEE